MSALRKLCILTHPSVSCFVVVADKSNLILVIIEEEEIIEVQKMSKKPKVSPLPVVKRGPPHSHPCPEADRLVPLWGPGV